MFKLVSCYYSWPNYVGRSKCPDLILLINSLHMRNALRLRISWWKPTGCRVGVLSWRKGENAKRRQTLVCRVFVYEFAVGGATTRKGDKLNTPTWRCISTLCTSTFRSVTPPKMCVAHAHGGLAPFRHENTKMHRDTNQTIYLWDVSNIYWNKIPSIFVGEDSDVSLTQ